MPANPARRIPAHKRPKHKGRQITHSFLRLPHYILESEEFAALPGNAAKLLLQVAAKFRGSNNGNLEIVWSEFRNRGWNSETTLQAARSALVDGGWLVCTRHPQKRRCGLYAISWEPIDECEGKCLEISAERVASNAWRKTH